jgi:protein-tyrosine phosphatase
MIDWHSHVLPALDDGSKSVDESQRMLTALKEQGIACVIATPHFHANRESVDTFLQKRKESYERLIQADNGSLPQILCGAEVRYYPGIAKMEGLERLAIDGGSILLLEMPMDKWTEYTVRELCELASTRGLTVILAHIERYLNMQSRGVVERLCANGLLMQSNASFFNDFVTRHKAFKLLVSGNIHFIGSDCHNMKERAPQIGRAYELIEKKLGPEYVSQMREYGYKMLKHK